MTERVCSMPGKDGGYVNFYDATERTIGKVKRELKMIIDSDDCNKLDEAMFLRNLMIFSANELFDRVRAEGKQPGPATQNVKAALSFIETMHSQAKRRAKGEIP